MTYEEEYALLISMIDQLQQRINQGDKDRLFLEAEMDRLLEDLYALRLRSPEYKGQERREA